MQKKSQNFVGKIVVPKTRKRSEKELFKLVFD